MQTLKFQVDITADILFAVEEKLTAIIFQRLVERSKLLRTGVFQQKITPIFFWIIRILSAFLIIATLPGIFMKASVCNSPLLNFFLFIFSCVMLFVFWDRPKLDGKLMAFGDRVNLWAAKKHAYIILKQAVKLAPFQAEYDFRGDVVTYYRIKNDAATFVWSRKITGYCVVNREFTLLFKNEKHPQPSVIIFHENANEVADYLKAHACPQLNEQIL